MVIPLTDLMNPYCRLLPKDVDEVVTIQVVVVMMVVVDVEEVIDLRGHLVLVAVKHLVRHAHDGLHLFALLALLLVLVRFAAGFQGLLCDHTDDKWPSAN